MAGYDNTVPPHEGYVVPAGGTGTISGGGACREEPPHEGYVVRLGPVDCEPPAVEHPEFHRGARYVFDLLFAQVDAAREHFHRHHSTEK